MLSTGLNLKGKRADEHIFLSVSAREKVQYFLRNCSIFPKMIDRKISFFPGAIGRGKGDFPGGHRPM